MKVSIKKIDRVLLLGGGSLLISLAKWCKSEGIPISVITSPRHSKEYLYHDSTLNDELQNLTLPYLITKSIDSDEVKNFLGDLSNTFCLSLGAPWIFEKEIISEVFKNKLFNTHGSRLPQNRGGGGFSWQIMMGSRLGFCQLHIVDAGIDTGDLVKTEEFLYPANCRIPEDYEKLYFAKNLEFLIDFIRKIRKNDIIIETTKQTEYFSSYWPRLSTPENGWIDWAEDLISLDRFICAFDSPYEGCKTFINSKKVFIKSVIPEFGDNNFHIFQSGIIYRKNINWLMVAAKGGSLIIQEVLDQSGKNIIKDIHIGDRFVTPRKNIDARNKRVVYTPDGKK